VGYNLLVILIISSSVAGIISGLLVILKKYEEIERNK
jgi:hypothetical protein